MKNWLKYIIEIFVIVFSILAAFWLEEYREERKEQKLETEILREIKANMTEDLKEIQDDTDILSKVVRSSEKVLEHLENDLPYNDSLGYYFSWMAMAANHETMSSGYELMLSTGSEIITNDTLRQQISKIYSSVYPHMYTLLKDVHYLATQPLREEIIERFRTFVLMESAIPADYEALKSDRVFKTSAMYNASVVKYALQTNLDIAKSVHRTIAAIENEIKRLEGD